MRYYESVFIARQDISSQQAEGLADRFIGILTDAGGNVARRENWGLRKLAYRINKNRKGHYVMFNYEAPADAVKEMERQMRFEEDVLRYMTVRTDALETEQSVVMQNRDRDDRPSHRETRGGGSDSDSDSRKSDKTSGDEE